MVIERDGEKQRHYEEQDENVFVIRANYQQEEEANQQDYDFGGDDIGENCSHEEAVFAFEKGEAVRTVMPDVKRLVNDSRLATRRTTQRQRTSQYPLDLF